MTAWKPVAMDRLLSRRRFGGLLAAGLAVRPAAASLATPQDAPILTISGRISVRNDGNVARFDRPMLEALGTRGFVTSTPWYKGTTRFDGVPMRTLLRAVGASGERIVALALNDYSTEIPAADFEQYDVLLALRHPFDSAPELQAQKFYNRSAWQLAQLVVG